MKLPCPFCGAKADTEQRRNGVTEYSQGVDFFNTYARCSAGCGDWMRLSNWNHRPTPSAEEAKIKYKYGNCPMCKGRTGNGTEHFRARKHIIVWNPCDSCDECFQHNFPDKKECGNEDCYDVCGGNASPLAWVHESNEDLQCCSLKCARAVGRACRKAGLLEGEV